jgi:hypothetical protein
MSTFGFARTLPGRKQAMAARADSTTVLLLDLIAIPPKIAKWRIFSIAKRHRVIAYLQEKLLVILRITQAIMI